MHGERDLAGKVAVVTGATAGIGQATARALAGRGAFVIGVGRAPERCQAAQDAICAGDPDARLAFCVADLSSQRQVRRLAEDIRACVEAGGAGKIDVLVNNAGAVASWYTATEDGFELQFAVNHLAPFLLTYELMPLLSRAAGGRVVTVASRAHRRMRINWRDVMLRRTYHGFLAYKQSKLANVLFTAEFNRRVSPATGVRAFAADPGLVNTQIASKSSQGLIRWVWDRRSARGASPEQGAETVIHLAADPSVNGASEFYWRKCQPLPPSRYAQRPDVAVRLWALSEQLCGIEWASA